MQQGSTTPARPTVSATPDTPAISAGDRTRLNDYIKSLPAGVRTSADTNTQVGIGDTLAPDAPVTTLPANVTAGLAPAPGGFSYVQAGSDVYLISNGDRRVVDRVGAKR